LWLVLLGIVLELAPATASTVGLVPLQDRTGEPRAAAAVHSEIRRGLGQREDLTDPVTMRNNLRRLRVRDLRQASSETVREIATGVGADYLVSVVLHEAWRDGVPRLTLTARAYLGDTGEPFWEGMESASGYDRRGVLGLGEVYTTGAMAQWVVGRLVEAFFTFSEPLGSPPPSTSKLSGTEALGTLAIIPFEGLTADRATANAEAVTEVVRTVAFRYGMRLVSPNCVAQALRQQRILSWGGAPVWARRALEEGCGADTILTGTVEAFEINEGGAGPEPRVALSMRLLNAHTGELIWSHGVERDAAKHPGLFATRRVYSLGNLTERLTEALTDRLLEFVSGG